MTVVQSSQKTVAQVLHGRSMRCACPQLTIQILTGLIHSRLGWILYSIFFTTAQAIGINNSEDKSNWTIYAVSGNGLGCKYRKYHNSFEAACNELTSVLVNA